MTTRLLGGREELHELQQSGIAQREDSWRTNGFRSDPTKPDSCSQPAAAQGCTPVPFQAGCASGKGRTVHILTGTNSCLPGREFLISDHTELQPAPFGTPPHQMKALDTSSMLLTELQSSFIAQEHPPPCRETHGCTQELRKSHSRRAISTR